MTVEVKAKGQLDLSQEIIDEIKRQALEDVRSNNENAGPLEYCAPEDVTFEVDYATDDYWHYTISMEVGDDD